MTLSRGDVHPAALGIYYGDDVDPLHAVTFLVMVFVVVGSPFSMKAAAQEAFRPDATWSGWYVGGFAGFGAASYDVGPFCSGGAAGPFDCSGAFPDPEPTGFVAGGTLGYNFQFEGLSRDAIFVVGVEADLGYMDLNETVVTPGATNVGKVQYGFISDIAVRAGVLAERTLVYAKGGVAIAEITNQGGDLDGGAIDASDFTSVTKTRVGYVVGAGIEFPLNDAVNAKAEYLFKDFGTVSSGNVDGNLFRHENQVHTLNLGINIKLDRLLRAN